MNTETLILFLARSSALILLALLAMRMLRPWPSAAKLVGRLALLATPLLWLIPSPALAPLSLPTPVPPGIMVPREPAPNGVTASEASIPASESSALAMVAETPTATWTIDPLTILWLVGTAIATVWLAFGIIGIAMLRRRSSALASDRLAEFIPKNLAVREADIRSPFVTYAPRPTLFLPHRWADSAEPVSIKAVVGHELAHLRQGDLFFLWLGRLAAVPLWFQPLLIVLNRALAEAGERSADSAVLEEGVEPIVYARALTNLAALGTRPAPGLGIPAVRSPHRLAERIRTILSGHRARPVSRFTKLATASAALITFALITGSVGNAAFNPATQVEGPYSGSIRILLADGKPATAGHVYLETTPIDPYAPGAPKTRLTKLQIAGGEVLLPNNSDRHTRGTLLAIVEGAGIGMVTLWPIDTRVKELRLPKPTTIRLPVRRPDGSPAANERMRWRMHLSTGEPPIRDVWVSLPGGWEMSATTSGEGVLEVPQMPAGKTVRFEAESDQYATSRVEDNRDLGPGPTSELEPQVLEAAGTIEGRVLRDGKGVPGIRVGAQATGFGSGWGEAVTDQKGAFRLTRLSAGTYNVIYNTRLNRHTAAAAQSITIAEGAFRRDVTLNEIDGTRVFGTVTGPNGKPLANTEVGCYSAAHPDSSAWVQMARTDAKGRYQLRLPPGRFQVYVMAADYESDMVTGEVVAGGPPVRRNLQARVRRE